MTEKSQKPTPQRIKESREKGQTGKSQDFLKLFILILTFEVFFAFTGWGMEKMCSVFFYVHKIPSGDFSSQILYLSSKILDVVLIFISISSFIAFLACISGNWLQIGPVFAKKSLKLKFDGMNPAANLKNQFSKKNLILFLANILKVAMVIICVSYFISEWLGAMNVFFQMNINNIWLFMFDLFKKVVRITYAIFLVFGFSDIVIQKLMYVKEISMSMDEIKKEYKQNEGDPMMKGYRKNIALEQSAEPPAAHGDLNNTDMLLVNPTHYAIGLRYKKGETPLPVVTIREQGLNAKMISERATQLNIPVVKDVYLTRSIFYTTELGGYIKKEALRDVAYLYADLINRNRFSNVSKIVEYKI